MRVGYVQNSPGPDRVPVTTPRSNFPERAVFSRDPSQIWRARRKPLPAAPAPVTPSFTRRHRRRNEFTTEGGKLHGAVAESMKETGMLEKSAKVVAAARAKGITVIHAPIMFKEDASDSSACVEKTTSRRWRGASEICFPHRPEQVPRHPRRLRQGQALHAG